MSVDAATIAPNIDMVAMAITDCCQEQFAREDAREMTQAMAMEACCEEWAMAGTGSITVPGCPACVGADGTVITPATGPQTITANSWGEVQLGQTLMQTNAYTNAYNSYLNSINSYQDAILIPQIFAFVAQAAVLLQMYQCWRDMLLGSVKPSVQGILDTFLPKMIADYCENIDGTVSEKMLMVADNFAGNLDGQQEAADWMCLRRDELWDCYFEDGVTGNGAGYAILEKQHVQNMAQHMATLCEQGSTLSQFVTTQTQNLYDDNELTFKAFTRDTFTDLTAEIEQLYNKAGDICAYMNTCGQALVDCYNTDMKDFVFDLLTQQLESASNCVQEIDNAIQDAKGCMQQMKATYDAYNAQELLQGPEMIRQANALAQCGDLYKQCWENYTLCSDEFKERYNITFADGEEALADKIFALACKATETDIDNEYEFAKMLAEECKAHWNTFYEPCDGALAQALMEEAKALYDSRSDTFETFCMMSEKYYAFWCDTYADNENNYVNTLFDKAIARICLLDDSLEEFCEEAKNHLEWWKNCFQDAECVQLPYVINAATKAVDQQADTFMMLDQYADELYEKFCTDFYDCDIKDLEALCSAHDKTDLPCEIVDDNACAQDMGERLKDCFYDWLVWEKEYLAELCAEEPYEPEFCDIEDRAVRFVTAQFDQQREEIIRCASRYCVGDVEDRLERLAIEQAKAEAAAMQTANRFERWWEVQEQNRRHARKLDGINIVHNIRDASLAAYRQSTVGTDALLSQIHARVLRGYNYLAQSNQSASTSASGSNAAVNNALQAAQIGHFFPELHANMKNQYHASSDSMVRVAQQQTQIGHQHQIRAMEAKQRADATASDAINQALGAMQHGQRYKEQALNASAQAERTAVDGANLGLSMIDRSRFWIDQAHVWKRSGLDTVNSAFSQATQSIAQGHNAMGLALQFEQQRDAMARACRDNGMEAAAHGLQILETGANKVRSAQAASMQGFQDAMRLMSFGIQRDDQWINSGHAGANTAVAATNGLMNIVAGGHNLQRAALTSGQNCNEAQAAAARTACQVLMDWKRCGISGIYGAQPTLATASSLSGSLGQGVGGALEGVLGSLTGILSGPGGGNLSPLSSAPPPQIGGAFGSNFQSSTTFGSFGSFNDIGNAGTGGFQPGGIGTGGGFGGFGGF